MARMNETGAIEVAIIPLYKERKFLHILTDLGATVIVCWGRLLQFVEVARNKRKLGRKQNGVAMCFQFFRLFRQYLRV